MWKLTTTAILVGVMLSLHLRAADLVTGYAFSSGEQNVTHTKLNNAVNLATISTGFYTDKSATTTPAEADLVLLYSASAAAFRKVTVANLITGNRMVITNQTADTSPATGDYILTFDISDGGLKKTTLNEAVYESAHLIANRTNWNTPAGDNFYVGYNGAWNKTARSNLWYQFWNYRTADFTNLATHTTPTNADSLVLWSSLYGTNRQLPLVNLYSNGTYASSINATDVFPAVVAGVLSTVPMSTLSNYVTSVVTNYIGAARFTSNPSNLVAGVICDVAHNLGGAPQLVNWVLVCGTADAGYAVNDEVPLWGLNENGNNLQNFQAGANSTNVFLVGDATATVIVLDKSTGNVATLTAASWAAKCYAVRF